MTARKKGMKALVVYHPDLHELDDYPFEQSQKMVRSLAAKNNLEYVNLLDTLRGSEASSYWVSPADAHPNAAAMRKYEAAIFEKLKSLGWIP